MNIVDLTCAVIGDNPVVCIATDKDIGSTDEVEWYRPYPTRHVPHPKPPLAGEDPTTVERIMRKIRWRGGSKPWGSAVGAIEMALRDLAGKAAGMVVPKLLVGTVRERGRVNIGGIVERN